MENNYLNELAAEIAANTIFTTKEVLTSEECAKYLGVSKSCLYKWTCARQIPHFKSPTGKKLRHGCKVVGLLQMQS